MGARTDSECAFDGCSAPVKAREYCGGHYSQLMRGAALAPLTRPIVDLKEKLSAYSALAPGGCIDWLGGKYPSGYGELRWQGRTAIAHRLAFELANGPIPEGQILNHTCRNRGCINPDHLEVVTHTQNIQCAVWPSGRLRGAVWSSDRGKWRARVTMNKKQYHFGEYDNREDAAEAAARGRASLGFHDPPLPEDKH